jgi:hypothetical protein
VKKLVLLLGLGGTFMLLPLIALLAILGVAGTAIACTPSFGGPLAATAPVPAYARTWVAIAQQACPALPSTFLAAVMSQESGFRPDAYADDKNGGTWGLFQMNRSIWRNAYGASWDADLNFNGVWDIKDPDIHAATGGKYLCARLQGVRRIRAEHPDWASTRELSELDGLVIAHNAGEGRLRSYPAIPAITARFIVSVRAHMAAWAGKDVIPPTGTSSPSPSYTDPTCSGIAPAATGTPSPGDARPAGTRS